MTPADRALAEIVNAKLDAALGLLGETRDDVRDLRTDVGKLTEWRAAQDVRMGHVERITYGALGLTLTTVGGAVLAAATGRLG